jgi:hypothetical protein
LPTMPNVQSRRRRHLRPLPTRACAAPDEVRGARRRASESKRQRSGRHTSRVERTGDELLRRQTKRPSSGRRGPADRARRCPAARRSNATARFRPHHDARGLLHRASLCHVLLPMDDRLLRGRYRMQVHQHRDRSARGVSSFLCMDLVRLVPTEPGQEMIGTIAGGERCRQLA